MIFATPLMEATTSTLMEATALLPGSMALVTGVCGKFDEMLVCEV